MIVKIDVRMHHIDCPVRDILHRNHAAVRRLAEPLHALDGSGNRSQPKLHLGNLLLNLPLFADQGGFD